MKKRKIILTEKEIPTHWYNIVADMENKPRPPLHPGTQEPIGPEMLAPLFPEELIRQEVSQEKWIEIPEEVREIYSIWRPTPIFRAEERRVGRRGSSRTGSWYECTEDERHDE